MPDVASDGGVRDVLPHVDAPFEVGTSKPCGPRDITAFTPTWVPPRPRSASCSTSDIDEFSKDCLDDTTATTTACNAFMQAHKACLGCLITPSAATAYGPAVSDDSGILSLNVAGCIALQTGDLSSSSCGAKEQAVSQCKDAACVDACPFPNGDKPAFDAYLKCLGDAEKTVCKAYATAVCPIPDAGAVAACDLDGASFVDNFKKLAPIFCASGG